MKDPISILLRQFVVTEQGDKLKHMTDHFALAMADELLQLF